MGVAYSKARQILLHQCAKSVLISFRKTDARCPRHWLWRIDGVLRKSQQVDWTPFNHTCVVRNEQSLARTGYGKAGHAHEMRNINRAQTFPTFGHGKRKAYDTSVRPRRQRSHDNKQAIGCFEGVTIPLNSPGVGLCEAQPRVGIENKRLRVFDEHQSAPIAGSDYSCRLNANARQIMKAAVLVQKQQRVAVANQAGALQLLKLLLDRDSPAEDRPDGGLDRVGMAPAEVGLQAMKSGVDVVVRKFTASQCQVLLNDLRFGEVSCAKPRGCDERKHCQRNSGRRQPEHSRTPSSLCVSTDQFVERLEGKQSGHDAQKHRAIVARALAPIDPERLGGLIRHTPFGINLEPQGARKGFFVPLLRVWLAVDDNRENALGSAETRKVDDFLFDPLAPNRVHRTDDDQVFRSSEAVSNAFRQILPRDELVFVTKTRGQRLGFACYARSNGPQCCGQHVAFEEPL